MLRKLKDNNLNKIKEKFAVTGLESQPILFIISKSFILISCTTISNSPL